MTTDYQNKALLDLPMQSWYYDGGAIARTKNLGSYTANVPMMGTDGTTIANFPTQITPRGMSFDGTNDRIRVVNDGSFNFTSGGNDQPFSVEVFVALRALPSTYGGMITKGVVAAAPGGWSFYFSSTYVGFFLTDGAGNYLQAYNASSLFLRAARGTSHMVATYSGNKNISGINCYANTELFSSVKGPVGVYSGQPETNSDVLIGPATVGVTTGHLNADILSVGVYPFELTIAEIKELHAKRRRMRNR